MSNDKSRGQRTDILVLVYMAGYADGSKEVRCTDYTESATLDDAGRLNAELHRAAVWYFPIGQIAAPAPLDFDQLIVSVEQVIKDWECAGSPKVRGLGEGPSPLERPFRRGISLTKSGPKN
jgi:hypothetical protein